MDYICPIRESTDYICGDPAVCLVAGAAICEKHAKRLELSFMVDNSGAVILLPQKSPSPNLRERKQ